MQIALKVLSIFECWSLSLQSCHYNVSVMYPIQNWISRLCKSVEVISVLCYIIHYIYILWHHRCVRVWISVICFRRKDNKKKAFGKRINQSLNTKRICNHFLNWLIAFGNFSTKIGNHSVVSLSHLWGLNVFIFLYYLWHDSKYNIFRFWSENKHPDYVIGLWEIMLSIFFLQCFS